MMSHDEELYNGCNTPVNTKHNPITVDDLIIKPNNTSKYVFPSPDPVKLPNIFSSPDQAEIPNIFSSPYSVKSQYRSLSPDPAELPNIFPSPYPVESQYRSFSPGPAELPNTFSSSDPYKPQYRSFSPDLGIFSNIFSSPDSTELRDLYRSSAEYQYKSFNLPSDPVYPHISFNPDKRIKRSCACGLKGLQIMKCGRYIEEGNKDYYNHDRAYINMFTLQRTLYINNTMKSLITLLQQLSEQNNIPDPNNKIQQVITLCTAINNFYYIEEDYRHDSKEEVVINNTITDLNELIFIIRNNFIDSESDENIKANFNKIITLLTNLTEPVDGNYLNTLDSKTLKKQTSNTELDSPKNRDDDFFYNLCNEIVLEEQTSNTELDSPKNCEKLNSDYID